MNNVARIYKLLQKQQPAKDVSWLELVRDSVPLEISVNENITAISILVASLLQLWSFGNIRQSLPLQSRFSNYDPLGISDDQINHQSYSNICQPNIRQWEHYHNLYPCTLVSPIMILWGYQAISTLADWFLRLCSYGDIRQWKRYHNLYPCSLISPIMLLYGYQAMRTLQQSLSLKSRFSTSQNHPLVRRGLCVYRANYLILMDTNYLLWMTPCCPPTGITIKIPAPFCTPLWQFNV